VTDNLLQYANDYFNEHILSYSEISHTQACTHANTTVQQTSVIPMYFPFHTEKMAELHACKHKQHTFQKIKKVTLMRKGMQRKQQEKYTATKQ
jgi:hypothetical protein